LRDLPGFSSYCLNSILFTSSGSLDRRLTNKRTFFFNLSFLLSLFQAQSGTSRRQAMLDYVKTISPSSSSSPSSGVDMPAPVVSAMRQTVANLLGTLPPQFFRVTISTRSDNLAQLMFSVLMTGYMFCNGWYRLQLANSMGSLTSGSEASSRGTSTSGSAMISSGSSASFGSIDDDESVNTTLLGGATTATTVETPTTDRLNSNLLAAGSQKISVEGKVLRWHHEEGVQQVPAVEYIEQLEEELHVLQKQLAAAKKAAAEAAAAAAGTPPSQPRSAIHETGQNELLEYLKGLTGEQVAELTDCATPDVLESMNALVQRMIGTDDDTSNDQFNNSNGSTHRGGEWGAGKSECTASELAHLLCWLMAVGHQLRTMEVRLSLIQSFENGPESGPDDGTNGEAAAEWVPRLPPGR